MKVKEQMTKNPIVTNSSVSVDEALGRMRKYNIRHLPVMQDDEIVGIVTDGQLSTAWFPSLLDDLSVKDVMTSDPVTIEDERPVYEAVRTIYNHKLTGLLVCKNKRLVGIITLADVLGLFVDMIGLVEDKAH